jgi:hypothetical protein
MRCYALLQEKFNRHMSCTVEPSTSCSTESGKRANHVGAKSNVQPQLSQQFVFTTHFSRASGLGVAKCTFHETGLRVKPLLLSGRCHVHHSLRRPHRLHPRLARLWLRASGAPLARQTVRRPLHTCLHFCVRFGNRRAGGLPRGRWL